MLRGKRREFAVGLFLTVITGGLYPLYWHYAAFHELYAQEERENEFPTGLFIACFVPLVNIVCQPLYMSQQLDFVNELRAQRSLPPTIGIVELLLWMTLGQLIVIGPIIAYYRLQ
ncbi:MAG: hypothetical protein ABW321_33015, partial [Polyangiales bacterium]